MIQYVLMGWEYCRLRLMFSINFWSGIKFYLFCSKVQAFSKFLYHEHIKNLLSKEKKWFKEYTEAKDYPGYYPYERAQQLYK